MKFIGEQHKWIKPHKIKEKMYIHDYQCGVKSAFKNLTLSFFLSIKNLELLALDVLCVYFLPQWEMKLLMNTTKEMRTIFLKKITNQADSSHTSIGRMHNSWYCFCEQRGLFHSSFSSACFIMFHEAHTGRLNLFKW